MKTSALVLIACSMLVVGCERLAGPDFSAPAAPTGLYTETGDNFIELFWRSNVEGDVAGYNVYVSPTYNGRYELIGSSSTGYFYDAGARNGTTYYYAVTAYDFDGNESDLSRDIAYDIPRPEGYNVVLSSYRQSPGVAGYDFSDYRILSFNDQYTDMYFEFFDGEYYMNVRDDTDIQDLGPTSSLLDIRTAPSSGWSPTHDAVLRVGHTYVVWTWDDHYAKFRVTGLSSGRVVYDWAYQLQESNPMLKPGAIRNGSTRVMSEGASRQ
jgi:hypothetical protein